VATVIEIEKLALDLSEQERAALAANLLESLPGILSHEDEGVAEALRRDAEIEADPNQAIESGEGLAVFVMNADGSERRQVTHIAPAEGSAQWPVWSSDGRQLAIQVSQPQNTQRSYLDYGSQIRRGPQARDSRSTVSR
jgi:hypothetical protein